MPRMRILSYAGDGPTPFDDQYLVEYDPARPSTAPDGTRLPFHLVTTPDPEHAHHFATTGDALECWRKEHGVRSGDGRPNSPLTAWTVEIVP